MGEHRSEYFAVAAGAYEQYAVYAIFTTREKAEAWAAARNALAVKYAGFPGLSCQTKDEAAKSYWVEEFELPPLDPEPETQWPQEILDSAGWKEPASSVPSPRGDLK